MADENEYEFTIDFTIGISGDCLGKIDLKNLKAKIKEVIGAEFENADNVSTYDVWQFETGLDYEKQE